MTPLPTSTKSQPDHPHDGYAYDHCSCTYCGNIRREASWSASTTPENPPPRAVGHGTGTDSGITVDATRWSDGIVSLEVTTPEDPLHPEPEECPLCDGTGWALAKGNGWVSAPRPHDGTETNCPLEGVHEHPFRGPHRFREWEPGT